MTGKKYDDYDEWEEFDCMAYDGEMNCMWWAWVTHHDNEHWYLDLHGYDDKNKPRDERHEVTQTLFEMVEVGQTVNLSDQSIVPK